MTQITEHPTKQSFKAQVDRNLSKVYFQSGMYLTDLLNETDGIAVTNQERTWSAAVWRNDDGALCVL